MRSIRAAFLLLLSACVSAQQAREGEHRPGPAAPQGIRVDPDLLREIDAVLQERFANVTGEDIKLSRFGFSRISPKEAHRKTFVPESEREREMLRRVSASGMRAAVYTVGNWHGPPPVAQGPLALGGRPWGLREGVRAASELGIACMKAGAALQGADGAMALEARPVVASKPICLRCHDNRKLGDVLGALITAFVEDRAEGPSSGE